MPTAEDYRAGVAELGRLVDGMAAIGNVCDRYRDDFGYTGGAAPLVREGLIAGAANASSAGTHCDDVRAELVRRVFLCELYTAEWNRYMAAYDAWLPRALQYWSASADERVDMIRPFEPQAPTPPFEGAEVSR